MKNKKVMPNGRQGFTLIELLIVIAIIGILASIAMVSLNNARNSAQVAAFKSQVGTLRGALVVDCDANAVMTPAAINARHLTVLGTKQRATVTNVAGPSCGPNGTGTFTVTARAIAPVTGICLTGNTSITANDTNFPAGC